MNRIIEAVQNNTKTIKNLSLYLLASMISAIIGVAINPFLAANLSPEDYSVIGYYSSFGPLFTPILNFSLISYYLRNYFKMDEECRKLTCDTIIVALLIWGAISSIAILGLFYIYCETAHITLPFTPFAILFVAQLFFNNFLLLYQVNCRLRRDAKRYFNISIVATVITMLLSVLLVVIFKFGAMGRLVAMLITAIVIAVYVVNKSLYQFRFDYRIFKEAFRFGWPISLGYFIQYFLAGLDMTLLEPLDDVNNMALYTVALSLTGYISILTGALCQTFEPDTYEAAANYNYRKLAKISLLIVSILLFAVIAFILLAQQITALLTYNRYTDAYVFARLLAFSAVTTYLMVAVEGIINAFGFVKICLISKVIAASIAVGLYILLIDNWGYTGAAFGRVIAPLIVFAVGTVSLYLLHNKIKMMRNAKN